MHHMEILEIIEVPRSLGNSRRLFWMMSDQQNVSEVICNKNRWKPLSIVMIICQDICRGNGAHDRLQCIYGAENRRGRDPDIANE